MADETHDQQNIQASNNSIAMGSIHVEGSIGGDLIIDNSGKAAGEKPRSLHQLPQPPADFTGREELIAQLVTDFTNHKGAAISGLTGMGGIGKTALGLVVAHKISPDYPDAHIFLDLKGTTAPLSAVEIVRHVLLSLEPGMDVRALNEENMRGAYLSVLHGKRVLLFLDNARSAEQIEPLRPPEPCAMLVTSRWTFPVPGLHNRRLDVLSQEEAEQLLLALCPRIAGKAADLAHACTHLPLALRVAGSFLQVNENWNVEKYIARLEDRKGRLAELHESREGAGLKTEPDLLAAFELSYGCLSQDEQKRWRTLGVFPASFDAQAVQAVWELEETEALKLLSVYLRYNLLDYDATFSRYSLHDLLADYACSKLDGEEKVLAGVSHSSYYSKALGVINRRFLEGGENILPALRLYDEEWKNIEAGQKISTQYLEENQQAARACNWYAWQGSINGLRLKPGDRIRWIEDGIRAAKALNNKEAEGAHLTNLGLAYAALGETRKAIEYYEQRMVIAREIGDRRGEGNGLGNLGNAYADLGETRKAIEYYEQRMVIAREIGDRRGEGNALCNMGLALYGLEEKDRAVDLVKQALAIFEAIESPSAESARNALREWGVLPME